MHRAYDWFVKAFIIAIATILAGFFIWSIFGVIINTREVMIEEKFQKSFYTIDNETQLIFNIRNNAPNNIPYFNPLYILTVTFLDAKKNEYAYFIGIGDKKCNFTVTSLDLGIINSGDSKDANIVFHFGENNVAFRIDVYLSYYSFSIFPASATYNVSYEGNYHYEIMRV